MFFLSHNSADKPFVGPIAHALKAVFGESSVFYDSWSIQPGESILGAMSEGLERATIVFVFFTKNSLASKMVTLEWYSALMRATNNRLKIIPVRAEDIEMPVLLADRLYVDLYTQGMDVAIAQIIELCRSGRVESAEPPVFHNLRATLTETPEGLTVTVLATHFLEPTARVSIMSFEPRAAFTVKVEGDLSFDQFEVSGAMGTTPIEGYLVGVNRAITTKRPLIIKLTRQTATLLRIAGIFHHPSDHEQVVIPTEGFDRTGRSLPKVTESGRPVGATMVGPNAWTWRLS